MLVVESHLKEPAAAKMLNMSESWLEKETADGSIPCIHFGRSVRYDVTDLRDWIESKKIKKTLAR